MSAPAEPPADVLAFGGVVAVLEPESLFEDAEESVVRSAVRDARAAASALARAVASAFFLASAFWASALRSASALAFLAACAALVAAAFSWAPSSRLRATLWVASADCATAAGEPGCERGHFDGLGHRLGGVRRSGGTGHRDRAEDATGNSGTDGDFRRAAAGFPVAGYVSGVGHGYTGIRSDPVPVKHRVLRHSYVRNI